MKCINCEKPTKNKKFCSRSCAASINNSLHKKRNKKEKFCSICGKSIYTRNIICLSCTEEHSLKNKTKREICTKNANSGGYPQIRQDARRTYMSTNKNPACEVCGYSTHIEIHHKKSIESFPPYSKISEINDSHNLVGLCPTHHWEADHQLLKFK